MDEKIDKQDRNLRALAWKIGSIATAWIVAPAVIGLFLGQALDRHWSTQPLWLLICMTVSFVITCVGLYRLVKNVS